MIYVHTANFVVYWRCYRDLYENFSSKRQSALVEVDSPNLTVNTDARLPLTSLATQLPSVSPFFVYPSLRAFNPVTSFRSVYIVVGT